MWQYLIHNVDSILKDYTEEDEPEEILISYKQRYIDVVDPGEDILCNCYACQRYDSKCSKCIIGRRVGPCPNEGSSFQCLKTAIRNKDRDEFIKYAEEIIDAWK